MQVSVGLAENIPIIYIEDVVILLYVPIQTLILQRLFVPKSAQIKTSTHFAHARAQLELC
jgi:hypothetical protein